MALKRWNTIVNRIHSAPDPISFSPRHVEIGEDLPTHMLVERMMNAGVKRSVENAIAHMYEFGIGEEVPEGYVGAGGYYSTDFTDIEALRKWIEAKLRDEVEEAERLAAEALVKKNTPPNPELDHTVEPPPEPPVG